MIAKQLALSVVLLVSTAEGSEHHAGGTLSMLAFRSVEISDEKTDPSTSSRSPTDSPAPSPSPSAFPSASPSISRTPSSNPSFSLVPSGSPSAQPSMLVSCEPTESPKPSPSPSQKPSMQPSEIPSLSLEPTVFFLMMNGLVNFTIPGVDRFVDSNDIGLFEQAAEIFIAENPPPNAGDIHGDADVDVTNVDLTGQNVVYDTTINNTFWESGLEITLNVTSDVHHPPNDFDYIYYISYGFIHNLTGFLDLWNFFKREAENAEETPVVPASASTPITQTNDSLKKGIAAIVAAVLTLLCVLCCIGAHRWRNKGKSLEADEESDGDLFEVELDPALGVLETTHLSSTVDVHRCRSVTCPMCSNGVPKKEKPAFLLESPSWASAMARATRPFSPRFSRKKISITQEQPQASQDNSELSDI